MNDKEYESSSMKPDATSLEKRSCEKIVILVLVALVTWCCPAQTDAQGSWTNHGPDGGTVSAIAFSTDSDSLVVAGTERGGVYSSADGGLSWISVTFGLPSLMIQTLAFDPSGTREVFVGLVGDGIYRFGTTADLWTASNDGLPPVATVLEIVGGSSAQSEMYAAIAGDGVFSSSDGGATWSALNQGLSSREVAALAVGNGASETVFAGTQVGVFALDAGSTTWRTTGVLPGSTDVLALAIDPSNQDRIYAGTLDGLAVSADGGDTWSSTGEADLPGRVDEIEVDPNESIDPLRLRRLRFLGYGLQVDQQRRGLASDGRRPRRQRRLGPRHCAGAIQHHTRRCAQRRDLPFCRWRTALERFEQWSRKF